MTGIDRSLLFAFDPVRRRPACVLLATALGANSNYALHFDADLWIVDGDLDDIQLFGPLTDGEVRKIAEQLAAEIAGSPA
jgi:hypothetical protein